jgi:hypothetical protein
MSLDKGTISLLLLGLGFLALLFAGFPFRNYLEVRGIQKKTALWMRWLSQKPNLEAYCEMYGQSPDAMECDFCKATRFASRIEMTIETGMQRGFFSNRPGGHSYFKSHTCSGCGTELIRERIDKSS